MSSRMAREFFASEVKNLESAGRAVVRATARKLKSEAQKQLKTFKKGPDSNGSFHKAVKIYDLEPRNDLGPASYVRLGVPWLDAFEEGKVIQGKSNLIILLPPGAELGFRRISKGNPWSKIWAKIQSKARVIKVPDGAVVVLKYQGRNVPIYKLQKQVKAPKKLSFYETAERLSQGMADEIERLMEGDL